MFARLKHTLGLWWLNFFLTSKHLASIYYLLKKDYRNEHFAVLSGRRAYNGKLEHISESSALLRRNTHRLEKGLIMKPRRPIFAESIISETVNCFARATSQGEIDSHEIKWAKDVLHAYFNVVDTTPIIAQAKEAFFNACEKITEEEDISDCFGMYHEQFSPYSHSDLPENDISFEALRDLFVLRRSVRWYQKKKVPLDLVRRAATVASFAPSACNRQPYRFHYCDQPEKVAKIAGAAGGATGFADNIPSIIAIVGDLSAYPKERDRHLIYVDGSLAAMQLMLALQTLGLASCSINWPDAEKNERRIRKIIDLKDYERIVMLMAVGYADSEGGIPYSQKKPSSLVLKDINS